MMVGRVAERFADRRYLLERVQEQQWFEERIVWLADGRLPEQVEQTAAIEDRLLGRDLLYLNRRKVISVASDFVIDSISQRNGRAHFCVLFRFVKVVGRLTAAKDSPVLFPLRVLY